MIQFLEDMKGLGKLPLSTAEREELEKLRTEQQRLIAKISKQGAKKGAKKKDSDASSDSDGGKGAGKAKEDNSDDDVSALCLALECE